MRNGADYAMKQSEFFKAFCKGGSQVSDSEDLVMLKVKDYPPNAAFAEEMPRHWQVCLPCPRRSPRLICSSAPAAVRIA